MASTFSANKNLQLQGTGDNVNAWGTILNNNVFNILDLNLGGRLILSVAGSSDVIATQGQAANIRHKLTGTLTGNINYILPNAGGLFLIENATAGAFTLGVKPVGGTAVLIPQGKTALIFVNPDTTSATLASSYSTDSTFQTISSGSTTDLGTLSSANVSVSGTTTITSLGSSAALSSPIYRLIFGGSLTLTHNGTSLKLPGSQNIQTFAGDMATALYLGSGNWQIIDYMHADGRTVSSTSSATSVSSSSTTDIGALTSNLAIITGTTTITALGSSASTANPLYFVRFSAAGVLTYNATSLILPGGVNILTAAGDCALFEYLGSGNWKCHRYDQFSGRPVSTTGATTTVASGSTTDLGSANSNSVAISGTTTITSLGSSASIGNPIYFLRFGGILTLTYNATSLIIPGTGSIITAAGDTAIAEYLGSGNWRIISYTIAAGVGSNVSHANVEGRLTLTTLTAVTNANVTAAGSIFFTPYKGDRISLFDGTATWNLFTFSEITLSLASGFANNTAYDIFAYNNAGAVALEVLAWTNVTTRATALVLQNGVQVKSGATTRRYIGSFLTSSTTTTEDSEAQRYVYNYYNRVKRRLVRTDPAASWGYAANAVRAANNSLANRVEIFRGTAEEDIDVKLTIFAAINAVGTSAKCGLGVDSTTTVNALTSYLVLSASNGDGGCCVSDYSGNIGIGYHFFQWLENTGTTAFTLTTNGVGFSGISGSVIQ